VARDFSVDVELNARAAAVVCSGDIDLATCDQIEDAVDQCFAAGPPVGLTVDMRSVTFIDSTGLRCLLAIAGRCEEAGLVLRVVAGAPVTRVFDLVGFPHVTPRVDVERVSDTGT
jgi:anti-anti-sigma factor